MQTSCYSACSMGCGPSELSGGFTEGNCKTPVHFASIFRKKLALHHLVSFDHDLHTDTMETSLPLLRVVMGQAHDSIRSCTNQKKRATLAPGS